MKHTSLLPYENQWVALTEDGKKVAASDRDVKKLHEKIAKLQPKKKVILTWVPSFTAAQAPHATVWIFVFSSTLYEFVWKDVSEFRPFVPIILSKWRRETLPFHALVDSGADYCLFPASFLSVLNIELQKGKRRVVYGIGEHKIETFAHKVTLDINGYKFKSEIYFSEQQQTPLLGRDGFFNKFKEISFDQKKKSIHFVIWYTASDYLSHGGHMFGIDPVEYVGAFTVHTEASKVNSLLKFFHLPWRMRVIRYEGLRVCKGVWTKKQAIDCASKLKEEDYNTDLPPELMSIVNGLFTGRLSGVIVGSRGPDGHFYDEEGNRLDIDE